MSVYWILDNDITNQEDYNRYKKKSPFFVTKHGGEFCVRGGKIDIIEGEWNPKRLVMIKFPSKKAYEDFIKDPEYRTWKELRENSSKTNNILLLEGVI